MTCVISHTLSAFLQSGVAILIASSDRKNKPSISRGFGVKLTDKPNQLTVFVTEIQSNAILRNIEQTGKVSLTAANVRNYESYQIKGTDAKPCLAEPEEQEYVFNYIKQAQLEMQSIGVGPIQTDAIFQSYNSQNLVGIRFKVSEIYCQTPGARAGKPL